jgi:hypothetical protein
LTRGRTEIRFGMTWRRTKLPENQEKIVNATERPAYPASWYTNTMVAAPERGALTSDIDVDVCVIGAGLAGLTTGAARLVGGGAGSTPDRLECVGAQYRIRAAGLRRVDGRGSAAGRA